MFVSLVLHEVSHAIVMVSSGGKIISFKPYPHYSKTLDGWRFRLGAVTARFEKTVPSSYRYSHIAPLIKAFAFMLLWGILGFLVWRPLLILGVLECFDAVFWWIGFFWGTKYSDGKKWRISTNIKAAT